MKAAADKLRRKPGTSEPGNHEPSHAPSQRVGLAAGYQHAAILPTIVEAALHIFVEQFEEGLAVVDKFGRALFLNHAARVIVGGVHLRFIDGYLRATGPSHSMTFRKMIAGCATSGCGSCMRLVSDDDTLLVAASAIPSVAFTCGETAVLLRLVNPATTRLPDEDTLQAQFGLTRAEAAFALEMLAGNDLAAIAARRGITINTARAHLRSVFGKTETRRQATLTRLLLLCPKPTRALGGTTPIPGPLASSFKGEVPLPPNMCV